jgi:Methyltransferase domain
VGVVSSDLIVAVILIVGWLSESSVMQCKICQAQTTPAFTAKILGKHDAVYFRCGSCGFMQTEEPHWLAESYASAINEIDLGPINRAMTGSKLIEGIILSSFDKDAKFVDYGAGYGVLVRLMRDRGFDFYWRDLYCENLFAKHFVAEPGMKFELLTAFEVFEHLVDPLAEIAAMLDYSANLLFSTLLVPERAQAAADWWYFGPDHGQHIAFYTVPALLVIAKRFNLYLSTDGADTHLLSQKPVSDRLFRFFVRDTLGSQVARRLLRRRMHRQSLLIDDFQAVSGYTV